MSESHLPFTSLAAELYRGRSHTFNCTRPSSSAAPPPNESGLSGHCWCRDKAAWEAALAQARELLKSEDDEDEGMFGWVVSDIIGEKK